MWTDYCIKHNIPIRRTGKIVTCKSKQEQEAFFELFEQGLKNKVDIKIISMDEAKHMEPTLIGYGSECIYSPTTSVMDTKVALAALKNELISWGVEIQHETQFIKRISDYKIETTKGTFETDFIVNAAGLDSLMIA